MPRHSDPHTCHYDGGETKEHPQRHLLQSRGKQVAPEQQRVKQVVLHGHQDQHHHNVGQEEPGFRDLGKRAPRGRLAERREL